MALALNYEAFAYKGINNYYIDGIEYEKMNEDGPLQRKVRFMIAWRDFLSRLGLKPAGVLAAIIFKIPINPILGKELNADGYRIIQLPRNPYLSA